jgi:LPS-assembly protein
VGLLRLLGTGVAITASLCVWGAEAATITTKTDSPLVPFQLQDEGGESLPFLLEADESSFDEKTGTLIASGSVRISREDRILLADRVEYRTNEKILSAKGNVTLVEPTGELLFADEVELTEDLDQGFAVAPRILLPDGTRLAAAGTSRISKDRVEVYRGVFSPCSLCEDDPHRAPVWQLRAKRISHSETRKEIELESATLDFFGIPVLWVPYFSQPDPRVQKKTGFLPPRVGSDEYLGLVTEIPFFWNIAPNRDLTIEPHIYTQSAPIVLGSYRHLFPFGQTEIQASGGIVERTENGVSRGNNLRGHIRATGDASINENWRADFQYYRSGDDTYLRTYDIDDAGILRSFALAEGFYRRLYVNATAFTVQEQRTNFTDDDTPTALPFVTADYSAPLGFAGLNLEGQLAAQVLFRPDGGDTQHGAARIGVSRQVFLGNNVFDGLIELRGDLFQSTETPGGNEQISSQIFPRATVGWSYPLFRALGEGTITLTPRAMATATPGGMNTDDLPNEDSQSFEFDSTALFRPAIADGRDRIDDGQRFDYGVEVSYDLRDISLSGLIGQSYRTNSSRDFGAGTGLDHPLSDVILGYGFGAGRWLDGFQRVRWSFAHGDIGAAESGISLSTERVQFGLQHTYLPDRYFDNEFLSETHQIEGTVRLQLDDHWAVLGRHRQDLESGSALRSQVGISYADECLALEIVGTRDRTRTAEVGPNNSIMFRIALRHLGSASGTQTLEEE